MSEEKLNEQYIKNKIQGICQDCMLMWIDKTIPIINKMLSEAYISGIEQKNFDLKMELEKKVEKLENIRKEAIEYISTCNDEKILNSMFLDESYISNYGAKDLLNILSKGDNNEKE